MSTEEAARHIKQAAASKLKQMQHVINLEEYITPNEAAQILSVTGRRVRQLLDSGDIAGKFVFGRWFVNRQAVYQYLSEHYGGRT